MNVYVRELTRFLGQAGVHVDVFTRSQDEHIPSVSHDLGNFNRVVHIPAGPEVDLPKEEAAKYTAVFAERIIEFGRKKSIEYDLVHAHYWMSGIAGKILKDNWNVPLLQMFHTLGLIKQRIGRTEEEREGEYRIEGEKKVLKATNRVIAATQAEVSQLEAFYHVNPDMVTVIPPGVDIHHFYPIPADEAKEAVGISPDERMALFVGRIEPLKGIDTLIRAMAIVKQNCRSFVCPHNLIIIGGEGDEDEERISSEMSRLQTLCMDLGLDEIVLFLGKRGQQTLPYYYSAAEVVVMPSFYESFGMVALEAMACGTPVIASRVGGLAHLVKEGETGYFVPAQDPEALAVKLRLLFNNEDLRKQMGTRAGEYARDFNWEKITAQMIKVYQGMI
jgi:D-inositol-3-phosphate glycosyltransferase